MAGRRSVRRIGVLGHVGAENLGDEAIITAVIQQIRHRYPAAEIVAYTGNPKDTEERYGITAFPIRRSERESDDSSSLEPSALFRVRARIRAAAKAVPRLHALLKAIQEGARRFWGVFEELTFLARCYGHVKGIDLLIVAGSNQLNDYFGGPWAFPFTLLKWCILAKLVRAKVAFSCCGAGPLDSTLGKFFVRYSLSLADYCSYRDEVSRRLTASIGVSCEDPVRTDLAFGLRVVQPAQRQSTTSPLIVGINPLPFFDDRYWPEHNEAIYQNYVRKLAAFAKWLSERGHRVLFFPTQLRGDPPVIKDIRRLLASSGAAHFEHPLARRPLHSLDDLMLRLSMMDIVVATRYHGILLSAALHKPVLAIAYYKKTSDLMAQIGQSACVVDINSFDVPSLAARFVAVQARITEVGKEIEQRTLALRRSLEREYDRVFGLLDGVSSEGAADEGVAALARLNG